MEKRSDAEGVPSSDAVGRMWIQQSLMPPTHVKVGLTWWVSTEEDRHTIRLEISDPYTKELLYLCTWPWAKLDSLVDGQRQVMEAVREGILATWGEEPF